MNRTFATLGTLIAAGVLSTGVAVAQSPASVDVVDSAFEPATLTVTAGEEVTWEHTGSLPHTVTSVDGDFDSNPDCASFSDAGSGVCMDSGDTFQFTFDTPGTYAYYCKLHGTSSGGGMAGTIVVEAAGAQASESPSESSEEPMVTGAMTVSDQSGDGTVVTVDSVTITGADGFVVIHSDANGAPGPVIGHAAIDEGTSTGVDVTLDDALTSDATVWPMLHVDAGTADVYEFPGADGPVSDSDGVVVRSLAYTVTSGGDDLASTGAGTGRTLALLGMALALVAGGGLLLRRRTA